MSTPSIRLSLIVSADPQSAATVGKLASSIGAQLQDAAKQGEKAFQASANKIDAVLKRVNFSSFGGISPELRKITAQSDSTSNAMAKALRALGDPFSFV